MSPGPVGRGLRWPRCMAVRRAAESRALAAASASDPRAPAEAAPSARGPAPGGPADGPPGSRSAPPRPPSWPPPCPAACSCHLAGQLGGVLAQVLAAEGGLAEAEAGVVGGPGQPSSFQLPPEDPPSAVPQGPGRASKPASEGPPRPSTRVEPPPPSSRERSPANFMPQKEKAGGCGRASHPQPLGEG